MCLLLLLFFILKWEFIFIFFVGKSNFFSLLVEQNYEDLELFFLSR